MIEGVLDRLPGARVLVLGDLMLDQYVWGDVRRISPEAPVPVVEVRGRTHVPGGADEDGRQLREALVTKGVHCGGVLTAADRPTTSKLRVIAHNQQVVRTDSEERAPLSSELEEKLLAWVKSELDRADAVVISDYA